MPSGILRPPAEAEGSGPEGQRKILAG